MWKWAAWEPHDPEKVKFIYTYITSKPLVSAFTIICAHNPLFKKVRTSIWLKSTCWEKSPNPCLKRYIARWILFERCTSAKSSNKRFKKEKVLDSRYRCLCSSWWSVWDLCWNRRWLVHEYWWVQWALRASVMANVSSKSLDLELKKCSFSYYFIWGYFIVFMIVENFLFRVINLFVWTLCLFLYYHLDIPIEFWGMNFPRTCCSLSAPKCIFVPIFGICIPFTTGIHHNTC